MVGRTTGRAAKTMTGGVPVGREMRIGAAGRKTGAAERRVVSGVAVESGAIRAIEGGGARADRESALCPSLSTIN